MDRAFVWDDRKARINRDKHGVPFPHATRVFLDPDRVELETVRPEDKEPRRKVLGVIDGRLFTAVYTLRERVVRIISTRRCNAREEKAHGPLHP